MILGVVLSTLVVAASPFRPLPADKPGLAKPTSVKAVCPKGVPGAATGATSGGIANLPFAMGRRFRTLDEYLTHLRCRAAPIDLPWWREVQPGVYEHVKTMPGAKRETATRADLMRRFGFSK
jgi:hypothetical protein